jgi:hypothetical protein
VLFSSCLQFFDIVKVDKPKRPPNLSKLRTNGTKNAHFGRKYRQNLDDQPVDSTRPAQQAASSVDSTLPATSQVTSSTRSTKPAQVSSASLVVRSATMPPVASSPPSSPAITSARSLDLDSSFVNEVNDLEEHLVTLMLGDDLSQSSPKASQRPARKTIRRIDPYKYALRVKLKTFRILFDVFFNILQLKKRCAYL